jgi:hypothetical protein
MSKEEDYFFIWPLLCGPSADWEPREDVSKQINAISFQVKGNLGCRGCGFLILLRSLYIVNVFAYYCGFYFMPLRPSNSNFQFLESTTGYKFWLPLQRYSGAINLGFKSHSKDEVIEVK